MKTFIRATFTVLVLGIATAQAQSSPYHTPAYNYYQNNWMSSGE
ncbi:MAG TPA: hypothetical protein VFG12_19050 [Rhodopila sp.]|jgi:hypothetical protein|nr:hypothetical protein [Rhodopila sp.]